MDLVDAGDPTADEALVTATYEELRAMRAGLREAARNADWEFQTLTGFDPSEMFDLADRIDSAAGRGPVLP